MTKDLKSQINNILLKSNLKTDNTEQFLDYFNILIKWNSKINIISKKEENIAEKLFAPSMLFFQLTHSGSIHRIVDLGSGSGFPAIPIKIYDKNIDITMIDANVKKTAFLNFVCTKLNIKCKIINRKIDNLNQNDFDKKKIDAVTVRGVNINSNIVKILKNTIGAKWLIHFTSYSITLPLELKETLSMYGIAVKKYKL